MLAKRELINGKPPFRIYKRARESLSRLNSEQIPPPLGEGRGRKRGHPPPHVLWPPHVHDAVEFDGQYIVMGMYNPTWPKTATVADLCLGRLAENDRFRALSGPNQRESRHPSLDVWSWGNSGRCLSGAVRTVPNGVDGPTRHLEQFQIGC
jgi:hypothetical protein